MKEKDEGGIKIPCSRGRGRWVATAALVVSLLPGLSGCYHDKHNSYQVVTDADGNLHRPDNALPSAPPPSQEKSKEGAPKQDTALAEVPPEADFGVRFYPGAHPSHGLDGFAQESREEDGSVFAVLETQDPQDKVIAFYRQEMPKAVETQDKQDGSPVVTLSEPTDSVGGLHSVEISAHNSTVTISLTSIPGAAKSAQAKDSDAAQDSHDSMTDSLTPNTSLPKTGKPGSALSKPDSSRSVAPVSGLPLQYDPLRKPKSHAPDLTQRDEMPPLPPLEPSTR